METTPFTTQELNDLIAHYQNKIATTTDPEDIQFDVPDYKRILKALQLIITPFPEPEHTVGFLLREYFSQQQSQRVKKLTQINSPLVILTKEFKLLAKWHKPNPLKNWQQFAHLIATSPLRTHSGFKGKQYPIIQTNKGPIAAYKYRRFNNYFLSHT